MNITVKIEYDNEDQYINTGDLIKYLAEYIKNNSLEKTNINLSLYNIYPQVKIDHDLIKIPFVIEKNCPDISPLYRQLGCVVN